MEEVVCVVEGVRAATGTYKPEDTWAFNEYDLFFTDKRLIFAVVRHPQDLQFDPPNVANIVEDFLVKAGVDTKRLREALSKVDIESFVDATDYTLSSAGVNKEQLKEALKTYGLQLEQALIVYYAFKRAIGFLNINEVRRKQFRGKTPDEILGLHPDSFEIPYENVKSVKLSRLSVAGTLSQGRLAGTLEILTSWMGLEKKFKFSIPKKRFEDVKKVVDKYLHAKLVGK